jgi:hypothetical protein
MDSTFIETVYLLTGQRTSRAWIYTGTKYIRILGTSLDI